MKTCWFMVFLLVIPSLTFQFHSSASATTRFAISIHSYSRNNMILNEWKLIKSGT